MKELGRRGVARKGIAVSAGREGKGVFSEARKHQVRPARKRSSLLLRNLRSLARSDAHSALSFLANGPSEAGVGKQDALGRQPKRQERQSLFDKGVFSAMNALQSTQEMLEEIKRKAALEAIRRQMQLSRQNIRADRRLSHDARRIAFQNVDRLEKRLLARENFRWRGAGIMKVLQLAAVNMGNL